MKKQMIAIALMASFAAPAFADNFEAQVFDTQPEKMKVAELSQQEMKETEGAFLGGLTMTQSMLVGGGMAGWQYALTVGSKGSVEGAVQAVGFGAAAGGIGKAAQLAGSPRLGLGAILTNQMVQYANRQQAEIDRY